MAMIFSKKTALEKSSREIFLHLIVSQVHPMSRHTRSESFFSLLVVSPVSVSDET